jgi:CubicO group peptidase (beta-lactamase class C family)
MHKHKVFTYGQKNADARGKKMKTQLKSAKRILLLLLALLMVFPGIAFAENDLYANVKNSADEMADVLLNNYGVSGIQYALVSEGKVVISGTAGVSRKSNDISLDSQTMFGVGSISKMFTTTAIMQLSDQGKLDLDEAVLTYLPEFRMADERYKKITVRMLLNHSSGIMGSTYVNGFTYENPSTLNHDNLLNELAQQKLKADPGAFSVYCNDGFTLAELIVERISGMSFSEFIRQNIVDPLGMTNTKTPQDDFDLNRLARTFLYEEETPFETCNMIGTGGVYSTAENLCRLGQVYMNDSGSIPQDELLSENAKKALRQKEYLRGIWSKQNESFFGYGLGWDSVDAYPFSKYNIQALIKGGDTGLYHGSMIVLPEHNMVFAVLLSGGSSTSGLLLGQSLLLQTLLAEGEIEEILPPLDVKAPAPALMPAELTAYTGIYANNDLIKHLEVGKNGTITMSALTDPDLPAGTYHYTSQSEFVNETGDKHLTFVKEANGKTYTQIVQTIDLPNLGQTVITAYESEKVAPNVVDDAAQKAWDERSGTKYYIVNEIPTSQSYHLLDNVCFETITRKELPGYVGTYKIIDPDTAIQDVQIPVMSGRDNGTYQIIKADGKEYLLTTGWIYISEKDIRDLYAGNNAICTIQGNGYARWYTINQKDAGKTMTVTLPENGSFAVYDEEACVYYTTVKGNRPVKLPENGKVVFIGAVPGDRFNITTK